MMLEQEVLDWVIETICKIKSLPQEHSSKYLDSHIRFELEFSSLELIDLIQRARDEFSTCLGESVAHFDFLATPREFASAVLRYKK